LEGGYHALRVDASILGAVLIGMTLVEIERHLLAGKPLQMQRDAHTI
jgi:hypothetical protein